MSIYNTTFTMRDLVRKMDNSPIDLNHTEPSQSVSLDDDTESESQLSKFDIDALSKKKSRSKSP